MKNLVSAKPTDASILAQEIGALDEFKNGKHGVAVFVGIALAGAVWVALSSGIRT